MVEALLRLVYIPIQAGAVPYATAPNALYASHPSPLLPIVHVLPSILKHQPSYTSPIRNLCHGTVSQLISNDIAAVWTIGDTRFIACQCTECQLDGQRNSPLILCLIRLEKKGCRIRKTTCVPYFSIESLVVLNSTGMRDSLI